MLGIGQAVFRRVVVICVALRMMTLDLALWTRALVSDNKERREDAFFMLLERGETESVLQ